jgi:putative ABC transport system ATP-binding protein
MVAISCRNIVKNYVSGQTVTPALQGIDLDINAGELFMLVGPSGCGKTTLISVIAGILMQDSGECMVLGKNFKEMKDSARTHFRGASIGFVFQSFNLIPTLNAVENVSIPLLLLGASRKTAEEAAANILSRVGLSGRERSRPSQLSGGQQQRVAIARALVHDPKVIVCDEPTSALDKDSGHRIMELFRDVALKDNRTLVIVTHDNRIYSFADRIASMSDGKIEQVTSEVNNLH